MVLTIIIRIQWVHTETLLKSNINIKELLHEKRAQYKTHPLTILTILFLLTISYTNICRTKKISYITPQLLSVSKDF